MKKYYQTFFLGILFFNMYGTCLASDKYAAEFLQIGIGARALGMGGSYVALVDDGTAGFWNSAGLFQVRKFQLHFGHVELFEGLAQHNFASFAMPLAHNTGISATWLRMGVEDIPRYPILRGSRFDRIRNPDLRSTGKPEGYFGDVEDALFISIGRGFDLDLAIVNGIVSEVIPAELSIGVTLKYIRQGLDKAVGQGQGIDIGFMFRLHSESEISEGFRRTFSIGANLRDISRTTITWDTNSQHRDTIPISPSFGIAYSEYLPWIKSRVIFTFDQTTRFGAEKNLGGEYRLGEFLFLRAGLQGSDPTFGAGIRIFYLQLDYAFVGYELGNTHRISACLTF